jgi:hypothetical protein
MTQKSAVLIYFAEEAWNHETSQGLYIVFAYSFILTELHKT